MFDSNEKDRYLPVGTALKVHLPPHAVHVASIQKFGDDSDDEGIFGYVAVTDVDRQTVRVALDVEGFNNRIRVAVRIRSLYYSVVSLILLLTRITYSPTIPHRYTPENHANHTITSTRTSTTRTRFP